MIYLDYSATTQVEDSVLDTFMKVSKEFPGNPNSLHKLGVEAKAMIDESTTQIAKLLGVKDKEIIYTSGSSEANNMAIKGICEKYQNRGKHIITTRLEHSSIYGPIGYLTKKGFEVDFVSLDENGMIDLEDLKNLMREDTILVSISAVNSEIGLRQRVEEIGSFLKQYPKCYFHVDATQCIGKCKLDMTYIDLMSFSAHKFYGIKGIGALVKKEGISLEPLIHGGKSTTQYRSGTPAPALIASFAKALRLALENLEQKYSYVQKMSQDLVSYLKEMPSISVNHNAYCIPHIVNFSVPNMKPETFQHALEEYDIYISTQSACASGGASGAVFAFTGDEKKAMSSVRISLSYKTTEKELEACKEAIRACIQKWK